LVLAQPVALLALDPPPDDFLEPLLVDPHAARPVSPENVAGAEANDSLIAAAVLAVSVEDGASGWVRPDVDERDRMSVAPDHPRPDLERLRQVATEHRDEPRLVEWPRVDIVHLSRRCAVIVDAADDESAPHLHRPHVLRQLYDALRARQIDDALEVQLGVFGLQPE
jgi:hypothetical protein